MKHHQTGIKQTVLNIALASIIGTFTMQPAHAANWLMLQGTENTQAPPSTRLFAFVQIDYQSTDDTRLPNGNKAAFNQMAPQVTDSSGFNVKRARIGFRGNSFNKDINYFLMTELGNNGITTGGSAERGQLTHASMTFNQIPNARVRLGLFKTPGSEESFKGIPVFNYINFTSGTDLLLIERFFDNTTGDSDRNGSVGAVRDTGIQLFDSFKQEGWESSYAVMLGHGNGVELTDNDDHKDLYLYASTEKVFGESKGPRRHGIKLYAWSQTGKRTLKDVGVKDRTRQGLGMTYYDGKYRLAAEYFTADGMIYAGTTGAGIPADGSTFVTLPDDESSAYQLDLGYRIKPNIELNIRYDALDNAKKIDGNYREFRNVTLGGQYFFDPRKSVRLNYEIRDITAPKVAASAVVHDILDSLDNRISAQVAIIF